jgi:purine-binding chemotaxis protein CheW
MTIGMAPRASTAAARDAEQTQVFTVVCGDTSYGLPIDAVLTIFRTHAITPAPLAPPEILGLINLRGKIVTATSLRSILELPARSPVDALAVCIEWRGEQFALIVDDVGDVVSVSEACRIPDPPNESGRRGSLASGVYHLNEMILPVLDVEVLFDFEKRSEGARAQRRKDSIS